MPGLDRKLVNGDYVDADGGEYVETHTIQPQLYHQLKTSRGLWWGDQDAGSDLYLVQQRGLSQGTIVFAKNAIETAAQPFVDAGQARDLLVEAAGDALGRLQLAVAITDTTTGERIDDIAPIGNA